MFSDLAATVFMGACALAVIAGFLLWLGRASASDRVAPNSFYGVRIAATRVSESAWRAGHRAAAPFMERYGVIVLACAALVILLTFVSDIAALIVHIIGVIFLGLGSWVIVAKADRGARAAATASDTADETPAETH